MDERFAVTLAADAMTVEHDGARRTAPHAALGADSATLVDELFVADDPVGLAREWFEAGEPASPPQLDRAAPPIGAQEVWAAGVTYLRSRDARMDESQRSGADALYDLVYGAERPELFLKATPHRVRGHGGDVRIRRDSTWDVPEPELALAINRAGRVFGCTIGNDMSSRSIEGENPLYLPQAKIYSGSASLGPHLVIGPLPPPTATIACEIQRGEATVFAGSTTLDQIVRSFDDLVEHLFRDNEFPSGAYLMTGTGVVPDDGFTLHPGDIVRISIATIGTLTNRVVRGD